MTQVLMKKKKLPVCAGAVKQPVKPCQAKLYHAILPSVVAVAAAAAAVVDSLEVM